MPSRTLPMPGVLVSNGPESQRDMRRGLVFSAMASISDGHTPNISTAV